MMEVTIFMFTSVTLSDAYHFSSLADLIEITPRGKTSTFHMKGAIVITLFLDVDLLWSQQYIPTDY